jgi:hypothetical protein
VTEEQKAERARERAALKVARLLIAEKRANEARLDLTLVLPRYRGYHEPASKPITTLRVRRALPDCPALVVYGD